MEQFRDTIEETLGNSGAVELLSSVLNSLDTPVAITDSSGKLVFANKAGALEADAAGGNIDDYDTETEVALGDGKKIIVKSRTSQKAISADMPVQDVAAQFEAGGLLSAILDELPVSVFVKDSELRHVFVNKANETIFQRPRTDVIGKSDMELYDAAISAPLMLIDKNVVETGATRCDHDLFEREGEDNLVLRTTKTRVVDKSGAKLLVGISVDMTEDKRREAELDQARHLAETAERSKSEFLANMSHEIRTPMNGVMGMAELLAATELDSKQRMFTDVIVKSGSALLTIINDILDFSKIDAGQLELMPEPFCLAEAIEDVATLVSSRVAEKDLELIVRVDPGLPEMVVGDVGRIRQIVTNLMGNAVKFTEQGHVYVNVNGAEDVQGNCRLEFRVEDTGIGIPEDKLQKVFEKFSQVDTSATRRHEGTGLGLSIASSLVKLMDGEIGVESKLGQGSTFWFTITLPVHGSGARDLVAPVDISNSRVLIIDDNEVNRSILSEQLDVWQFEHAACVSGHEGLQVMRMAVAQSMAPDLIILDYQMPEMTGADVLREMRGDPQLKNIPVIILTSVDSSEANRALSGLGAEATLTKPTRSSLMLETMVEVISRARAKNQAADRPASFSELAARVSTAKAPQLNGAEPKPQPAPSVSQVAKPIEKNKGEAIIPASDSVAKNDDAKDSVTQHPMADGLAKAPKAAPQESRLDILVAEDNEVNQIVIRQILEESGYSFKIVENGRLAVASYKVHRPRLILMDVSMPEMNGFEATIGIRELEQESGAYTPIIGVTAHALKGDMEKCLDAGMDDYISKPISVSKLNEKLDKYLKGSRVAKVA